MIKEDIQTKEFKVDYEIYVQKLVKYSSELKEVLKGSSDCSMLENCLNEAVQEISDVTHENFARQKEAWAYFYKDSKNLANVVYDKILDKAFRLLEPLNRMLSYEHLFK